VNNFND